MNGHRKFKSLRLVRFGDIVYDQQRRLILLCRTCQRHYLTMEAFHTHLGKCIGSKHIVSSINELQYDEDKRETRLINGKQEVGLLNTNRFVCIANDNNKTNYPFQLLIYEPNAVRSERNGDIDWEAELEDPRWYTDDDRSLGAKARQLPINVKENVVKTRKRHSREAEQQDKQETQHQTQLPAKCIRRSSPKRTILTNQQQRKSCSNIEVPAASVRGRTEVHVPNAVEQLKRLEPVMTSHLPVPISVPTAIAPPATTLTTARPTSLPMVSAPTSNTQQILNKLRACGVQVRRSNPRQNSASLVDETALSKRQQALDIMRKLQSNGIKCTKVNSATVKQ